MAQRSPTNAQDASVRNVDVLSIGAGEQDSRDLQRIFDQSDWPLCPNSKWHLSTSSTIDRAISDLQKRRIPILFYACDHDRESWKTALDRLRSLPDPPNFIVTSRMADDHLWAEALNLGAYDVLAKPFDQAEVIRVASLAWLRWANRGRALASVA